MTEISIHTLLAVSDNTVISCIMGMIYFYPHSPCGERPLEIPLPCLAIHNFYPHSPCGERLTLICEAIAEMTISIHTLLAVSDNLATS